MKNPIVKEKFSLDRSRKEFNESIYSSIGNIYDNIKINRKPNKDLRTIKQDNFNHLMSTTT